MDEQGAPRFAFKLLGTDALVNSILGVGGRQKDALQQETGTRISISRQQEVFPGTKYRTLIIGGDNAGDLVLVFDKVVDHIVRCGDQERSSRGPGPRPIAAQGDLDFVGKEAGEYVVRAAIPSKIATAVIGPGGSNVQAFRKATGARIVIDQARYHAHQIMRVVGSPESLRLALRSVNELLQSEAESDWYAGWVAVRIFNPSDRHPCQYWYDGWAAHGPGGGMAPVSVEGRGRSRTPPRRGEAAMVEDTDGRGEKLEEGEDTDEGLLRVISSTAQEEPLSLYVLDEEYSISCELPADKVEAMRGPDDQHVAEVELTTGVRIRFEDVVEEDLPEEEAQQLCTLVIEGPLLEVYQAHALMMSRYHEVGTEAGVSGEGAEEDEQGEAAAADVEALDAQEAGDAEEAQDADTMRSELAELEAKLALVRGMKKFGAAAKASGAAAAAGGPLGPRPAAVRMVQAPRPAPAAGPKVVPPPSHTVPKAVVPPTIRPGAVIRPGPAAPKPAQVRPVFAPPVQRTPGRPGAVVVRPQQPQLGKGAAGKGKEGWLFSRRV